MGNKGKRRPNANILNIFVEGAQATAAKVKCSVLGNSGQAQRPLEEGHRQEEDSKVQI